MRRHTLALTAALLLAGPASARAQGVPHPGPARVWRAPERIAGDSARAGGGSMPAAGAIFGGLFGLAIGLNTCHSCDASGRPLRGLVGAATGAAIGFALGSLLETF
jgi:hypothetical protein